MSRKQHTSTEENRVVRAPDGAGSGPPGKMFPRTESLPQHTRDAKARSNPNTAGGPVKK